MGTLRIIACIGIALSASAGNESFPKLESYFCPGSEAFSAIQTEINQARDQIDVAMFIFNSEPLAKSLTQAARRGCKVRVLLGRTTIEALPELHPMLEALAKSGVEIFLGEPGPPGGKIHTKLAVIDSSVVITGSANWSLRAFQTNMEDLLIIRDPEITQIYSSEISKLIHNAGKPHEFGRSSSLAGHSRNEPRKFIPIFSPDLRKKAEIPFGGQPKISLFPGAAERASLLQELQAVQRSFHLAVYEIRDRDFIEAIANLSRSKKVAVSLYVDGRNADDDTELQNLKALSEAGVSIFIYEGDEDSSMHLKAAILDEQFVWTGSANWSRGAFFCNFEDVIRFESADLARRYLRALSQIERKCQKFNP